MSRPRVEEVSDSDPEAVSDPEEVDLDDFAETDILRQRPGPSSASPAAAPSPGQTTMLPAAADRSAYNGFQCLYPVYFDAARSRRDGRRVSAALAVRNPLAREIANACSRLRLPTLLEPEKLHPKDWANPGRVKVGLKQSLSASRHSRGAVPPPPDNKHRLYVLVARHLRDNPTTEASAGLRLRVGGGGGQVQPPDGEPYPRPAVPRGWKMGQLLPYLSAAMTGGGVSENLFKDMMKEMQGGGDPMAALMASQAGGGGAAAEESGKKKKKDKKGKGKA